MDQAHDGAVIRSRGDPQAIGQGFGLHRQRMIAGGVQRRGQGDDLCHGQAAEHFRGLDFRRAVADGDEVFAGEIFLRHQLFHHRLLGKIVGVQMAVDVPVAEARETEQRGFGVDLPVRIAAQYDGF